MISAKLVQLIEDHSDGIAARVLRHIQVDPRLAQIGSLPETELRSRARDILKHLGHWLTVSKEREVAKHFEQIGAHRFDEGIPMAEVALAYMIVKREMIEFVRNQGLGDTTVALYAEEELEHVIGGFFDAMLYDMIKGYEDAAQRRGQFTANRRGMATVIGRPD